MIAHTHVGACFRFRTMYL